jgi:hypothetical protein
MNQNLEIPTEAPQVDSPDFAWSRFYAPLAPAQLVALCSDIEAMLRINPYYVFRHWVAVDTHRYHMVIDNSSSHQRLETDVELVMEAEHRLRIRYGAGVKRATLFVIEPLGTGSTITVVDEYGEPGDGESEGRPDLADKSLPAWAQALRTYFARVRRWSWVPGWRWYMRRVWMPMTPSARRVVWMLYLITLAEFGFFLFVLLIFVLETGTS